MPTSDRSIRVADTEAVFRTTDRTDGGRNGTTGRSTPTRGTLHDPITGLANESLLLAALRAASEESAAETLGPSLVVVQIDRILHVGTCFGPQAQKSLLETVALRLSSLPVTGAVPARTGEHEFAFLAPSVTAARQVAAAVEKAMRKPIAIGEYLVLPAARIGIATRGAEGPAAANWDAAELLRDARLAADGPTTVGHAGAAHFDPRLRDEAADRMRLEAELSLAVGRGELRLHYQPMISIDSGEVSGFEALLRWEHPLRGTILPDQIIPLAEETGLIEPIGDWVLNEACRQMAAWQDTYAGARGLTLNVNISARQLEQPDLVSRVLEAQRSNGLGAGTLRLELTESVVISNEVAVERLRELREHGIEIQLDDFGSGYSSLGYLGRLPIDSLKLDKTFLDQCEIDSRSATILNAIIALARELGLAVTAEGIETKEQAERIRTLACETGQGFFFHRPLAGDAVEQLLVA